MGVGGERVDDWIVFELIKVNQLILYQERNYLEFTQRAIGKMTHRVSVGAILNYDSFSAMIHNVLLILKTR